MRTVATLLSGCLATCLELFVVSVNACRLYSDATGQVHFVVWTLVLTLPIDSNPPVNTDACIRALSGISLQEEAGVIATRATFHTGFQIIM